MLFYNFVTSSLLVATALAAADPKAFPAPYRLGKMSLNQALGLMGRQDQNGYAPTQTLCGPGADCPTACGADTAQCASNDGDLHCYTPSIGQQCCPDGSGVGPPLHLLPYSQANMCLSRMLATKVTTVLTTQMGLGVVLTCVQIMVHSDL